MTVTAPDCAAELDAGDPPATDLDDTEPSDYATAMQGVRALLRLARRNPDDPHLLRTPARVTRALIEMTSPAGPPPAELLAVTFAAAAEHYSTDQMIAVGPVPFTSLCEHHLLPFPGHAWVAYLPGDGQIVGLSKLARLVDWHARQLQVQERLTRAVTHDLERHLSLKGAACMIEAAHSCMSARGIAKAGAVMRTTSLTGAFRSDARRSVEFSAFCDTNRPR